MITYFGPRRGISPLPSDEVLNFYKETFDFCETWEEIKRELAVRGSYFELQKLASYSNEIDHLFIEAYDRDVLRMLDEGTLKLGDIPRLHRKIGRLCINWEGGYDVCSPCDISELFEACKKAEKEEVITEIYFRTNENINIPQSFTPTSLEIELFSPDVEAEIVYKPLLPTLSHGLRSPLLDSYVKIAIAEDVEIPDEMQRDLSKIFQFGKKINKGVKARVSGKEMKKFLFPSLLDSDYIKVDLEKEERVFNNRRISKKARKIGSSLGLSIHYVHLQGDEVVAWVEFPEPSTDFLSRAIEEKVLNRYNLSLEDINYYSYTPEDMSEPLEEYWYLELRGGKKELETVLKKARKILDEIHQESEKVAEKLLKL